MYSRAVCTLFLLLAVQVSAKLTADGSVINGKGKVSRTLLLNGNSLADVRRNSRSSALPGASASSSINVRSTNGTISAEARAVSSAISSVRDAIAIAFDEATITAVEEGADITAIAEARAVAVGEAIAEAYTAAIVEIESDSETTEGCASAFGDASSAADAFALAFVQVAAEADNRISYADSIVEAEAISVATAEAFAEADVSACLTGEGDATAEQESLSVAIVNPYAEAIARAFAMVTSSSSVNSEDGTDTENTATAGGDAKAISDADEDNFAGSSSNTNVEGKGTAEAVGTAAAETEQVPEECSAPYDQCCRSGRGRCFCGFKCRAAKFNGDGSNLIYEITSVPSGSDYEVNDKCFCA